MNKHFITVILVTVVVIVGFLWLTKPKASTPTSSAIASNHVEGKGTKNVTLVEYGDFQCPACGAYYPVVKQVVNGFSDQIFFQFRNFPLESLHQNARAAARAAEAASMQDKFWEMHDVLYTNQTAWSNSSDPLSYFTGYATQAGVKDITKFTTDYKSAAVNDIINADLKEGGKFNISGTPTFILDGKKIENPRDEASFNKLITDEITTKNPTK